MGPPADHTGCADGPNLLTAPPAFWKVEEASSLPHLGPVRLAAEITVGPILLTEPIAVWKVVEASSLNYLGPAHIACVISVGP